MAPEQLEGRPADARTDLFAFGVMLYEMATGRKAFEGESQASLIASILTSQPPPISTAAEASRDCLQPGSHRRALSPEETGRPMANRAGCEARTGVGGARPARPPRRRRARPFDGSARVCAKAWRAGIAMAAVVAAASSGCAIAAAPAIETNGLRSPLPKAFTIGVAAEPAATGYLAEWTARGIRGCDAKAVSTDLGTVAGFARGARPVEGTGRTASRRSGRRTAASSASSSTGLAS